MNTSQFESKQVSTLLFVSKSFAGEMNKKQEEKKTFDTGKSSSIFDVTVKGSGDFFERIKALAAALHFYF